jgi:protein tyrosine/serine phosphatase
MDSIYRGDLRTRGGRLNAWVDALVIDHAVFRLVWNRFTPVVPGRLYRSGHPTPRQLAAAIRRHGIRTVVNLRGRTHNGADALMREACEAQGVAFIDAGFGSREAPYRERVLRLAETFATLEQPALVHCKSGADRAGIASAIYLLINGATAKQAMRQLSLRFGHVRQSKTGVLDAFVRQYARDGEGRKPFLDWVRDDYDRDRLIHDFRSRGLADFFTDRVLARE